MGMESCLFTASLNLSIASSLLFTAYLSPVSSTSTIKSPPNFESLTVATTFPPLVILSPFISISLPKSTASTLTSLSTS
jgi:hypothetical protein